MSLAPTFRNRLLLHILKHLSGNSEMNFCAYSEIKLRNTSLITLNKTLILFNVIDKLLRRDTFSATYKLRQPA